MAATEVNKFSKNQQRAILGHAIHNPGLWAQLNELGIKKNWFEGAPVQDLYDRILGFATAYSRPPGLEELKEYLYNVDATTYSDKSRTIDECVELAAQHGLDILRAKLTDWAKSRFIAEQASELSALYNKGDHVGAFKVWETGAVELQRIDTSSGAMPDHMEASSIRVLDEEAQRIADGAKMLQYGVPFLDSVLCGILSNDLIMVGARTGAGKTELAKIVAMNNAKAGKRVSFFALEGEDKEIERRIKFPYLVDYYSSDNSIPNAGFGYAEWRLGRYKDSLDTPEYKARADAEFLRNYSTLKTYYRVRGDFGINDLDREVMKVHKDSDLIILDHLHFVDLDGKDENREQKKLVTRLRQLALELGVPILCIAHLKKGASKNLVPELDDFMGSSDISKIATTCITLAPCHEFNTSDPRVRGSATFMRIAKFRLDGTRTPFVGIGFYDKSIGAYRQEYCIGKLNYAENKWIPARDYMPYWAKIEDVITDVSEVE
jgi:replicative DNA helicase